jgi:hypothetical protein
MRDLIFSVEVILFVLTIVPSAFSITTGEERLKEVPTNIDIYEIGRLQSEDGYHIRTYCVDGYVFVTTHGSLGKGMARGTGWWRAGGAYVFELGR